MVLVHKLLEALNQTTNEMDTLYLGAEQTETVQVRKELDSGVRPTKSTASS